MPRSGGLARFSNWFRRNHRGTHWIRCFLRRSITVVGASERAGSVGQNLLSNLRAAEYAGELYPVNNKHRTVAGMRSYATVREIGRPIDLAVIAVPAASVAAVVEDCGQAGVRGAVVISAGFAESGSEGVMRQASSSASRASTASV